VKRSKKKLRNRMARQVVDGKITVTEARARLGRGLAQKPAGVQKSAGVTWPPAPVAPRYPGDESYIRSAFRPLPRSMVTASAPAPREGWRALTILKSTPVAVPGPVRPMRAPTSAELATLRAMERITDPVAREQMRSGLMAQMDGVLI
jgi:hypothetical protein